MIKSFGKYIIRFIVLVLIQVLIFNNIQLSGFIIPCFYVLFILLLPFDTPKWALPLIGFLLGLSIDLFTQTPGIHASATVLMAFVRPFILNAIAPREGYEPGSYPTLNYFGLEWFFKYSAILIGIHHFFLFYVEIFRISDFFSTLLRALLSSAFSILFIILSQYFIFKRS
jgi:rod shape-determining protein MreD